MKNRRILTIFATRWKRRAACCALTCGIALAVGGCAATPAEDVSGTEAVVAPFEPSADEEMRAVWVTYTEQQELTSGTAEQAAAAIDRLVERLRELRIHTLFWHVRANSDAYYASETFAAATWTQPLLEEGFDPLAYAIEAAHSCGIALHAWINPFRIGRTEAYAVSDDRFAYEGVYYYDPSSDEVRTRILDGIRELLDGYAVDGIHFDDYFYPAGAVPTDAPASFEQDAYAAYVSGGGTADIAAWRRLQVDRLIAATYRLVRSYGRTFGVSPAARLDYCTDALYADVGKWMREAGYVDYVCPQVYFGFENASRPFSAVVDEWAGLPRHASVKLYVGLAVYKAGMTEDAWAGAGSKEWANGGDILARQIRTLRENTAVSGFALYSVSYTFEDTHGGLSGSPLYQEEVVKRELAALHAQLCGEAASP